MTESVHHGTVAARRTNGKHNSCKSKMNSSYLHSGCFVSGSRGWDKGCMLRGHISVFDGTGQIRVGFI